MNDSSARKKISPSRWISIASMMTALALVGNYAFVAIPNVELGSTILLITSYIFGFKMGIWVTLIMAAIFGSINPWGTLIPQIWITQVIGWIYIALSGGIMSRNLDTRLTDRWSPFEFGVVGLIATLFFDLITNIGYSWAFSVPFWIALVLGLPFLLIHVTSNMILFAAAIPRISSIIGKQFAPYIWQTDELLSEE
ncbi:MAG: hypothetical protein EAX81_05220 [Candidatus Thorarchaeota archaeon]|nr:hypothetical protein [Candidatus Thorarchaeota archaeon]